MKPELTFIAKRSKLVEWSGIRTISSLIKEIGPDSISLGIGQPDFDTPPHIIEAAKSALEEWNKLEEFKDNLRPRDLKTCG